MPGELIHIYVKKLVPIERAGHRVTGNPRGSRKGIGWEYVHVCVDDATRLAYVEVLPDEKAVTAVGFLRRAVAHYGAHGIQVQKLMTYNGPAYISIVHKLACTALESNTPAPGPTRPEPTGKRNASSAPCSAAGPTAPSTAAQTNYAERSPARSTTTIADDHTAASATNHP